MRTGRLLRQAPCIPNAITRKTARPHEFATHGAQASPERNLRPRRGGKRMSAARSLRDKWARGETAFGVWAALPDAFAAELMCVDGVDYICVDQQHGLVDYAEMVEMLRAIEGRRTAVPLTRVPVNQAWIIGKALDAGMQGVVVPMVNNRAEAAARRDGVPLLSGRRAVFVPGPGLHGHEQP